MIEAAVVTPFFFLFLFAVIEFGSAYGDKLTVSNITTSGARTASTSGSDGLADYNILQAIKQNGSAAGSNAIQQIIIYKANQPTGSSSSAFSTPPPSACTSGTSQPNLATFTPELT